MSPRYTSPRLGMAHEGVYSAAENPFASAASTTTTTTTTIILKYLDDEQKKVVLNADALHPTSTPARESVGSLTQVPLRDRGRFSSSSSIDASPGGSTVSSSSTSLTILTASSPVLYPVTPTRPSLSPGRVPELAFDSSMSPSPSSPSPTGAAVAIAHGDYHPVRVKEQQLELQAQAQGEGQKKKQRVKIKLRLKRFAEDERSKEDVDDDRRPKKKKARTAKEPTTVSSVWDGRLRFKKEDVMDLEEYPVVAAQVQVAAAPIAAPKRRITRIVVKPFRHLDGVVRG